MIDDLSRTLKAVLSTKEDLGTYVESLLSSGGTRKDVSMQAPDIAAREVERGKSSSTPEQVVNKVVAQQPLEPDQREALKQEVKIIQGMNEKHQSVHGSG